MSVLLLFFGGFACLVIAVWIYSSTETSSYAKINQGILDIQIAALKRADLEVTFDKFKAELLQSLDKRCAAIMEEKLAPVKLSFDEAIKKAESVRKEQDFLKVQFHTLDKKVAAQPKVVKFEINRPVPVEAIKPPPPPKKQSLLKRSGVTP